MTSQSGKIDSIAYDHRNLPTRFEMEGGGSMQAAYNADGQRILKESSGGAYQFYVMDGQQTLAVIDQSGFRHFNLLGNDTFGRWESGGTRRYYVKDHLGSTRAVVDNSGTVLETFDYYPFGLLMPKRNTAGANTMEKFTGHELDDEGGLNLFYAGARYLDPALGRWHGVDPLADEYPEWSPYNYVMNNPILFSDPTGMYAECPEECGFFTRAFNYLMGYEMGENEFNQKEFAQLVYEGAQEQAAYEAENIARKSISAVKDGSDLGSEASYSIAAASALMTVGTSGASSKFTVPLTGSALQSGLFFEGVGTAASGMEVLLFQKDPAEFKGRFFSTIMGVGITKAYDKKVGAVLRYLSTSTQATRRVEPSFRLRSATHAAADATGVVTTKHLNSILNN